MGNRLKEMAKELKTINSISASTMNRLKEMAKELDDTRHALDESHMIIAKIVDQLLCCIQDCEEALEEGVTDGSEQVYEGRQELAESLLDTIEGLTQ